MRIQVVRKRIIFCVFLFILLYINVMFAASLKKGVYEIYNPRNGNQMYVNENGKVLLKSTSNTSIGECKDLLTGERKLLYKSYAPLFDEKDWDNDKYENLIDSEIEYFNLNGEKQDYNKRIMVIFNNNILFEDGTIHNIDSKKETKIKNIDFKKDYKYEFHKFNEFCIIDEYKYFDYYGRRSAQFAYIYDKNYNFLTKIKDYSVFDVIDTKKHKQYCIFVRYNDDNDDEYFMLLNSNLKKVLEFNYLYGVENDVLQLKDKDNIKYYDLNDEKYVDNYKKNTTTHVFATRYTYDNEKLISKIFVNGKIVEIEDVKIDENAKCFVMNEKKYIYVRDDKNKNKNYIYDMQGNRIKILPYSDKSFKIINCDNNGIVFSKEDEDDKKYYIYDEELNYKWDFTMGSSSKEFKSCFNGEMYYLDRGINTYSKEGNYTKTYNDREQGRILFDSKFNILLDSKDVGVFDVKQLNDDYIVVTNDSKVYDKKFNIVKEFDFKIKNVFSFMIGTIKYHVFTDSDKKHHVYNDCLEKVFDNYDKGSVKDYNTDGKYLLFYVYDEKQLYVYDEKLKIVDKVPIELENENINSFEAECRKDRYIIIKAYNTDENNDYIEYSLYEIGKGYLLKNYQQLNLYDDYIFYKNGFNYGIMDYNLKKIGEYSIFDDFEDDVYNYDF